MQIHIQTIQQKDQRIKGQFGDWEFTDSGDLLIRVSNMGDEQYELLLAIHEFVEAILCRCARVTTKEVDEYDRSHSGAGDTFCLPDDAPYSTQHYTACIFELMLAKELGVNYDKYIDRFTSEEDDV